jgi:hypothetical protein
MPIELSTENVSFLSLFQKNIRFPFKNDRRCINRITMDCLLYNNMHNIIKIILIYVFVRL